MEVAGRSSAGQEDLFIPRDVDLKKIMDKCFPSPLRHIDRYCNQGHRASFDNDKDCCFDLGTDSFPVNERVEKKISKGERIDVISLLSSTPSRNFLITGDGFWVDVNTLKGKYVVVCCVFLPLHYSFHLHEAKILSSIIVPASAADCPFQLVIVPKLLPGFDSHLVVGHFFSAFPSTCLTIDYRDSISCDHVCNTLGLSAGRPLASLIVDPDGTVLQTHCRFFISSGIHAFPFTDQHLHLLSSRADLLKRRVDSFYYATRVTPLTPSHATLDELLLCHPSRRLPLASDEDVSISVSDLNAGYVGLYLCNDGCLMTSLAQLHQQCTYHWLQFGILIIPLAFLDPPSSFLASIRCGLSKCNISSWWLFPFDERVCRRLWRLAHCSAKDELIILPPAHCGLSGEVKGKAVITHFGFNAYPFTRASILERNLERLRKLTLKHLFPKDCPPFRGPRESLLNMPRLQGKKVIIYLDPFYPPTPKLLFCLLKIWNQDPYSALVYVPPKRYKFSYVNSSLPWLFSRSDYTEVTSILFDKR